MILLLWSEEPGFLRLVRERYLVNETPFFICVRSSLCISYNIKQYNEIYYSQALFSLRYFLRFYVLLSSLQFTSIYVLIFLLIFLILLSPSCYYRLHILLGRGHLLCEWGDGGSFLIIMTPSEFWLTLILPKENW